MAWRLLPPPTGDTMKAIVTVGLKPGVLDVQGKAVAGALKDLGFGEVRDVRINKQIEIQLDGALDSATAAAQVRDMCEKLLANTVIESYRVDIA
jgi:phosphoribosylformylglycinamidine synthase subunit PurS